MAIQSIVQSAGMPARDDVRKAVNNLTLMVANHVGAAAAGIIVATTTTKVKFVNTVTYRFEGVNTTLAAADNFWTLNGPTVPISSFQKWLLCVDSAQAAFAIPGVPASTAAGVTFGALPNGYAIFGGVQVATDATHTFIPATTAIGATGITTTYWDGYEKSLFSLITLA